MCRCEAILYVQKMQELGDGGADVQMAHGLAKACSLRIGTTRVMDSHSGDIIPDNYSEIKEKVNKKSGQGSVVRGQRDGTGIGRSLSEGRAR